MIAGIFGFLAVSVIAIVLWIVFIPVVIVVDSLKGQLEIMQRATFKLRLGFTVPPELRIFGVKTTLVTTGGRKSRKTSGGKTRKINRSVGSWLFLLRGCLRSLSLRKLIMDLDTGDVVLNAQMAPVMFFLSGNNVALSTNFNGRMYLYSEIELRLNKLLWTWVLFLTKK
jgi:hypothetical protein